MPLKKLSENFVKARRDFAPGFSVYRTPKNTIPKKRIKGINLHLCVNCSLFAA